METQPHRKEKRKTFSTFHFELSIEYGGVAQLGEHLPCKQGVMGSIPIISTSPKFGQPKLGVITQKLTSPPDGKSAKSVKA